jgi:hypothetical protein
VTVVQEVAAAVESLIWRERKTLILIFGGTSSSSRISNRCYVSNSSILRLIQPRLLTLLQLLLRTDTLQLHDSLVAPCLVRRTSMRPTPAVLTLRTHSGDEVLYPLQVECTTLLPV